MQLGYGTKFRPAAEATRSIDGIAAATTTSATCRLAAVNLGLHGIEAEFGPQARRHLRRDQ
jgi:hypothetical protein